MLLLQEFLRTTGIKKGDSHGHNTRAPQAFWDWRTLQIELLKVRNSEALGRLISTEKLMEQITDEMLRESLEKFQLRSMGARGTDFLLFGPRASWAKHSVGTFQTSAAWADLANWMISRMCKLYPKRLVPMAQTAQSPGIDPSNLIAALEKCQQAGFVGFYLNPDPSDTGHFDHPLWDPWWFPFYEFASDTGMVMVPHSSESCDPCSETTGAHYMRCDTSCLEQLGRPEAAEIFKRFPHATFQIGHGGGAFTGHWGRFAGIAQNKKRPTLKQLMMEEGRRIVIDGCVYDPWGYKALVGSVPIANIIGGDEMFGAVGEEKIPGTDRYIDDTQQYLDATDVSTGERQAIMCENIFHWYALLQPWLERAYSVETFLA